MALAGKLPLDNGLFMGFEATSLYASSKFKHGADFEFEGSIMDAPPRAGAQVDERAEAFINVRFLGGSAKGTSEYPSTAQLILSANFPILVTMETKVENKGFSVYLAVATGATGIVTGVAGSLLGLVPALAMAVLGAGLLGFFGAALMEAGKKRKPAASPSGAAIVPESQIPLDRTDVLTGLANANGLAAWFSEKAQRLTDDGKVIFILLADLDKADEIERLRGKETVEAVIKEVAKRVSGFTGSDGIAARTGNDEFVAVAAVLPANALEIAEDSAGKLAEILCRPVDLGGGTIWIGGAVGAATGSPQDSDGVLTRAKSALQKARKLGLGRFWVDGVS